MNIIDACIILFLLFGVAAGIKNGFGKQLILFVSFFIIVVLSFTLKDNISVFLYEHLPFFSFGGIFKGVTILNIAVYEFIAFLIIFILLNTIFKLIMYMTGLIDSLFEASSHLGSLSKILGAIAGVLEYYVIAFLILYVLALPVFNIKELKESKVNNFILKETPLLSSMCAKSLTVIDEFATLKDKYDLTENASEFNLEALDLFLKYDVISVENVDKLVANNKLKIDNIESVLIKYREVSDGTNS